ncbi:MAG: hypothetical protein HN348_13725 [Proteobacteria bacterium]|mgnify:CR=1 FL=1|jgi:hypothetical protein|nr:hypothetical protein [Pseudomonadota bacterium]
MALWFLVGLALAGNPYEGRNSNITVERNLPVEKEQVLAVVTNLAKLEQVYPSHCLEEWVHGTQSNGLGAVSRVTYRFAHFKRRLAVEIVRDEGGIVDLDHHGDKGFVTRFTVAESEGGSKVKMETYVNAPGWPFRRYFFETVQPLWIKCYEQALQQLPSVVEH